MTTHHQPEEVIATYKFLPSSEESTSAVPNSSNSSTPLRPKPVTRSSSRSFASTIPADEHAHKNLITICNISEETQKVENYTHVAHVVLGTWKTSFLCKYDEPTGLLHNAKVIDMNESMQKATGWREQDDEMPMTRKEDVEEQRADVKYGVFKKPRSKTVGLCTLKEKDDAGWRVLELRTRGGVVGAEGSRKGGDKRMVSSLARRVVGGVQMTHSSVAEAGKSKVDDGRDEDQEELSKKEKETTHEMKR